MDGKTLAIYAQGARAAQMTKWEDPRLIASERREFLVDQLETGRNELCGVGTRKVKLYLNRKVKEGDSIANIYRLALELEDANISAKKYFGKYRRQYYDKKEELLEQLIQMYIQVGNYKFGYHDQQEYCTKHIMYFELPEGAQISYHCNLRQSTLNVTPIYDGEWDGIEVSSLPKIEEAIIARYGTELLPKVA